MKKPLVSIIILNFNGLKDTVNCLNSIFRSTYTNYEILLVDNGSDNNEGNILKKYFGKTIRVITLKKNLGFTGGNNWALERAKGKYVILLNNDTEVTPSWIEPLVELLERNKKIAVVQPKLKMLQKKDFFEYAGAAGGFIDKYGYPFTRGRIFETKEKDIGQYDRESEIFWASGAACMVRRSIIGKVGGLFDPIFFNYMEEIDFCWRVWESGFKIYYCPSSTVYHKGAATSGKNLFKKRYWEHRNNLILLYKNMTSSELINIFFPRIAFELITYIHYLMGGQFTYLRSLFYAHKDFLLLLINNKLIKNKNFRKVTQPIPYFPSSIVISYHVLKKRLFKSLEWSPKGNISFILFNNKKNTGSHIILSQAKQLIEKGYFVRIFFIFGFKPNWFSDKSISFNNVLLSIFYRASDVLVSTFWPTAYFSFILRSERKYYYSQDWGMDVYNNIVLKYLARISYLLPLTQIAVSKYLYDKLKIFSSPKNVIYRIRHCILDSETFTRHKVVKKASIKRNNLKILSVISWYSPAKGCDQLKSAIINLKKNYPNYRFTLVSREKVPFFNGFDKFYSDPKQDVLARLYSEADIFLATSKSEGFFLPALESMASGTPVVTTDNGGVNEYAKNKNNCIMVKNLNDIWEKNVIDNLIRNKTLLNKIIINGLMTAGLFHNKNMITELEDIYFPQNKVYLKNQ